MTFTKSVTVFLYLLITQGVNAVELKDATLRDEDISASTISVEYYMRPDGLMEYVYSIKNPVENKGIVDDLLLDLSCGVRFEPVDLPSADGKPGYEGNFSLNKLTHTPVAILADYGSAAPYMVTRSNGALWGLYMSPGKETTGLRLISPAKPGMRSYTITPWVDYDESWLLPEDISLVPKAHDFAITGMIAGPGCPGVTEPPLETNRYPGTNRGEEPNNINQLLSYLTPQKNRFHVTTGTKETTLHIFYSKDIDAKTFKVKPGWMKKYFTPVAGTDEKVTLPLKKVRTKIKLSVHTLKVKGSKRQDNEMHHSYKDTDKFEIRVDKK